MATKPAPKATASRFVRVNTRLFTEDVEEVKRLALASGVPWQIELRSLLHRALKEREVPILEVEVDQNACPAIITSTFRDIYG